MSACKHEHKLGTARVWTTRALKTKQRGENRQKSPFHIMWAFSQCKVESPLRKLSWRLT